MMVSPIVDQKLSISNNFDKEMEQMKYNLFWKLIFVGCLLLVFLTSCQIFSRESTSCEDLEGNCLELYFDGENCTFKGPTEIKSGHFTLLFYNQLEEGEATVNFLQHTGDETIQDAIEFIGEEPTRKHHPRWTVELDTWNPIPAGEIALWEGDLDPGTYHMVCVNLDPVGGWFGTGVIVEQ